MNKMKPQLSRNEFDDLLTRGSVQCEESGESGGLFGMGECFYYFRNTIIHNGKQMAVYEDKTREVMGKTTESNRWDIFFTVEGMSRDSILDALKTAQDGLFRHPEMKVIPFWMEYNMRKIREGAE
jgi:hypothetical protein